MQREGRAAQFAQGYQRGNDPSGPFFGGGRRVCTSFGCGEAGHYSYECMSLNPLSGEEQWRVKQQVEMAKMQRGGQPPQAAPSGHPPIPAQQFGQPHSQAYGLGGQPVVANPVGPEPQRPGVQIQNVAMVEVVSKSVQEEMQVPQASLVEWFEASAVEKSLKRAIATDSGEPRRRRVKNDAGPDFASKEEQTGGTEEIREKNEGGEGGGGERREKERVYDPPGPAKVRKTRTERTEKAAVEQPIRMMKDLIPSDIVAQLRDTPVSGLCWGTLFDLAPAVRRDVAKGLIQERLPKARKPPGLKGAAPKVANAMMAEWQGAIALPDDGKAVNFYTTARHVGPTGMYNLQRVLVDGGSVVNSMPEDIARKMNLQFHRSSDLMIKTANAQLTAIHDYVELRLEVAGVTANLKAYIIPGSEKSSYSLLLSRRWLRQCRARGNYETDTYIIKDARGNEYQVESLSSAGRRTEGQTKGVPLVVMNPNAATVELDEETVEELSMGEDLIAAIVRRIVHQADDEEYDAEAEAEAEAGNMSDSSGGSISQLAGKGCRY